MSTFPLYSDIPAYVDKTLSERKADISKISKLNAWIRVSSAVDGSKGSGMMLYSNPDYKIFKAAGDSNVASLYGNTKTTSTIGVTWGGGSIDSGVGSGNSLMPSPVVDSVEIDQGEGGVSRTASISITVFTKEQLEIISEYFLEPGYTIFLEIGWNDSRALTGFASKLNATHIGQYQNFENLNKRRKNTSGLYENYLGYITGGTVSSQGTQYTVQIKCTGFAELPSTLTSSDNSDKDDTPKLEKSYFFTPSQLLAASDEGKKRFMMMFNELPSNRRTARVQEMINFGDMADPGNFMNFDETVRAKINEKSDVGFWGRLFGQSPELESTPPPTDGEQGGSVYIEVKEGTEIVQPNRYIRFWALMQILNAIGVESIKVGNENVSYSINSKGCIAGGFLNIFSIDAGKLFIPNDYTPYFNLASAQAGRVIGTLQADGTLPQSVDQNRPTSVKIAGGKAQFPQTSDYSKTGDVQAQIPAGQWGYIDNLYVNFDFVKGILETPNMLMKDALYEILNGMSSAVNGLWNFQIVESSPKTFSENSDVATELSIVDLNLPLQSKSLNGMFEIQGTDSIFQDVSLDIDLTGAKMNQIIAERSNITVSESQPSAKSAIYSKNKDLVIEVLRKDTATAESSAQEPEQTDDEALKARNVELFMERIAYVPAEDTTTDSDFGLTYESLCYVAAYADSVIFNSLRHGSSVYESSSRVPNNFGPLLPIKCSFTIHGVSGINRGNRFKLKGIPEKYQNNGFFQVTSVKQSVSGMMWKTDVTGEFRPKMGESE